MSFLDRAAALLDANVAAGKLESARVASLRDGTDVGGMKADYLAALYQRKRTLIALQILDSAGVKECDQRKGYRAEVAEASATMDRLEGELSKAGINVRKVVR